MDTRGKEGNVNVLRHMSHETSEMEEEKAKSGQVLLFSATGKVYNVLEWRRLGNLYHFN